MILRWHRTCGIETDSERFFIDRTPRSNELQRKMLDHRTLFLHPDQERRCSSMRQNGLHIQFEKPVAGWIRICLNAAIGEAEVFVSHTPNDFIRELVNALLNAAERPGSYHAVANEEPSRVVFCFGRSGERLKFKAYEGASKRTLVEFTGHMSEVILPFWRSLRGLEAFSETWDWQWEFPDAELQQLGAIGEALKSLANSH